MRKYLLPYFAELDLDNIESFYQAKIEYDSREIHVELNFENSRIDIVFLDLVKKYLLEIYDIDQQNRKYIENDYNDKSCDAVRTYVNHHLEVIDNKVLLDHLNFVDQNISLELQLINSLQLIRIGFYPDSEFQFAVFDYSIDTDLTQYLIVVNTNQSGNLEYISMES